MFKYLLILLLVLGIFFGYAIVNSDEVLQKPIAKIGNRAYDAFSFRVSPDGNRYAYIYPVPAEQKIMVIDGKDSEKYEDMTYPVFSPDSKHIAYAVKDGDKWFMTLDGKKAENGYDMIHSTSLTFTNDSKHLAYSAKIGDKWSLVVDGIDRKQYDFILRIEADLKIPDGFRYLVFKEDDYKVYLIEEKAVAVQLDAVTRQKLQALESAHNAGILSDEEYQRKKAELLGQNKTDQTSPTDRKGGKTYNSSSGLSFWYPDKWTIKEEGQNIQLVPPDQAMMGDAPAEIYSVMTESVAEVGIQRPDDPQVVEYLNEQMSSLSPSLRRVGEAKSIKTDKGSGIIYDWETEAPSGGTLLARVYVSIDSQKGLMLLCLGLKDSILSRDQSIKQIFSSFAVGKPQVSIGSSQSGNSDLMQHFAGTWVNYTKNTETQVTLLPDGRYSENYEASYSGSFSDQSGADLGGWGNARQDQSQGRWTVNGDRQQGTITITYQNGEQMTVQYRVHVENGQTYWNEYYFNGDLYGKQ